ncbi:tetraacyldisaccharide 4'-kinase [Permianibacter sp. IMCC34836]|uniref:tetraacyldisaccharide 4'-kinase n=1 Tax=Permianibacter fluminis TaxID=2738515 RepID=UPI001554DF59|nr:tetraacyldisaccharide 4'-kinase [Permianibacter fluminis]NQD37631.1 tetraacyldisaccharide 4'-kinase [Permianibacter fluminis]
MSLAQAWYGPRWRLCGLWPLHVLMRLLVAIRRRLFRWGWLRSEHPGIPVIVVGNISVGGTGKTPLVLWLAEHLRAQGWQPGIVSRGYGGKAERYPCIVTPDSAAAEVGDEPLLLQRASQVPVVVDPKRARAAAELRRLGCNIVISDDGLQHYALRRDIEIVVIDAVRQLGNGWLLPAGPLRELPARLQQADFRVGNGAEIPGLAEHVMRLQTDRCLPLLPDAQARTLADFRGQTVHAVAGIGNPARFFTSLRTAGLSVLPHPFPDHHGYQATDLPWRDAPVLMTEKDAVKCRAFAHSGMWFVRVRAELDERFVSKLDQRLQKLKQDYRDAGNAGVVSQHGIDHG